MEEIKEKESTLVSIEEENREVSELVESVVNESNVSESVSSEELAPTDTSSNSDNSNLVNKTFVEETSVANKQPSEEININEPIKMDDNRLTYKVLSYTNPQYPKKAIIKEVSYKCTVTFRVNIDGTITDIDVPSDKYGFDKEITKSIKSYKFTPILVGNLLTPITFTKEYVFTMEE